MKIRASRIKRARGVAKPFRVTDGDGFRLKDIDPGDTLRFDPRTSRAPRRRSPWASRRWPSCRTCSTRRTAGRCCSSSRPWTPPARTAPSSTSCPASTRRAARSTPSRRRSAEDLDHDYLWRCMKCLPERGRIGIFNRSYYEETLVVRVHPEFLAKQKLPPELVTKDIWKERFQDIRNFERYLTRNGIVIRKFFLHVSKKEQKKRFLERLENPEKNWKFSANDIEGARVLERLHEGLRGHDPATRPPRTRRGTSCPPTTSGSPASWSPPRSSTRWPRSTSSIRRSAPRS